MDDVALFTQRFEWKVPSADPNDRFLADLVDTTAANPEFVIFGMPFDGAVLGRKGAAGGPGALRHAARNLKAFSFYHREPTAPVIDLGDVVPQSSDIFAYHALVERAARIAKKRAGPRGRVIALGGDHSLSYPCALPYLEEFGERLMVVNLDAHLDVRDVLPGHPPNSGTSFGRLLKDGLTNYHVIGVRDFQTSPVYAERLMRDGHVIQPAGDVFLEGASVVARNCLDLAGANCEAIYLSVDLDVADASVAPGVSAPTPGGIFAHELFNLLRVFAEDPRVIACDIMELAPNLEEPNSDRTARLAAGCLAQLITVTDAHAQRIRKRR